MKKEFTRTARKSYMVVRDVEYVYEKFELQMILQNHIPMLLDMQMIIGDGEARYWYDVTGMQSLENQISLKPISEERLRKLLISIINLKLSLEEYLLNDENVNFAPDMIFYDRVSDELRFCYIPGYETEPEAGMELLFETILQRLDHSDGGAVRIGYDMYERYMKDGFVIEDCRACMRSESGGAQPARPLAEPTPMEAFAQQMNLEPEPAEPIQKRRSKGKKMRREKKPEIREPRVEEQRELRNEFSVPQASAIAEPEPSWSPTELFDRDPLVQIWELVYVGNGLERNMRMTRFPYLIGKDKGKVDGELVSRTISRIHAKISERDNELYLEDYNSTNGTYLNGKLIPMNTPCKLQEGDQIIFATEEFRLERRSVPVT